MLVNRYQLPDFLFAAFHCHNFLFFYDNSPHLDGILKRQRAEKLNDSLQVIIKEVSENKSFFDFKSFLEDIAIKCSDELNNEILKPFTAAQKDFDKKIKELVQMNKVYPVLDTEAFLGNYKKTS